MVIRKLAHKVLFLALLFIPASYIKPTAPLLMHTDYYPRQPLLLANTESFDLDAFQLRSVPAREKQLSTWQLFLMKISCSVVVTASSIYDYIVLKVAAIRNYLARKLSTSTTSTSTQQVPAQHE